MTRRPLSEPILCSASFAPYGYRHVVDVTTGLRHFPGQRAALSFIFLRSDQHQHHNNQRALDDVLHGHVRIYRVQQSQPQQ